MNRRSFIRTALALAVGTAAVPAAAAALVQPAHAPVATGAAVVLAQRTEVVRDNRTGLTLVFRTWTRDEWRGAVAEFGEPLPWQGAQP